MPRSCHPRKLSKLVAHSEKNLCSLSAYATAKDTGQKCWMQKQIITEIQFHHVTLPRNYKL